MGLKLRLDMPEQAMTVTNVFFRATTAAKESQVSACQALESHDYLMFLTDFSFSDIFYHESYE